MDMLPDVLIKKHMLLIPFLLLWYQIPDKKELREERLSLRSQIQVIGNHPREPTVAGT